MSKILRIHEGASNTINGWENSVKIGIKAIDSIPDPVGATDKKEITSIPSPFARMDLVKRAFKYVAEHNLEGRTAYHKLVSDSLDVGQIFFNIEKYRDILEIIVWDKNQQIDELLNSRVNEHRRLGSTYRTYLQQDSNEYNFDLLDSIYLLNYTDKTGPDKMNIIGATSPATLFFTTANDLSYVKKKIRFGTDCPFDSDYRPLYQRETEYVKYWYSIQNSRPDFAKIFPEIDRYLNKCFRELDDNIRNDIRHEILDEKYYKQHYDEIPVAVSAQQYVTILNQKLREKRFEGVISSGFEMRAQKKPQHLKTMPLALPVSTYTEATQYTTGIWNKNTYVPFFDSRPVSDRTLPDDGAKYPYVTIGDFLEDYIVRIPYKFNAKGFFNGNDESDDDKASYLLPLKTTYFDYFSAESLRGNVSGKKVFEIQRLTGETGVKVILRIPIKSGDYIQYERIYYKGSKPDIKENKGAIIEKEFTLGQFPALKFPTGVAPYYRVVILDRDSVAGDNNPYSLEFHGKDNKTVDIDGIVKRNRNLDGARIDVYKVDSITYAISKEYEYIHITGGEVSAIVIPYFAEKSGNHKYRFAIDFGTSNTHIEYSVDGGVPVPFDISLADTQIQKLHITDEGDLKSVFNSDFIPETIGGDSIFRYPMRTALTESQNTNWSKAVFSMAHTNIPFTYEKNIPLSYNILHTDLKWSSKQDDRARASKYIENILIMLRNKVLLNNGDVTKTEVVWFYPASMTQGRFSKFKTEWENSFMKLFNALSSNIISIPESVAPYYYHKNTHGATSRVVSIDIGGGTTDVLIVDRYGEPENLTSFRFAANTIFGDGYSYNSDTNGIVNKYTPIILQKLEVNRFYSLKDVLNLLCSKKISTDIIAFYFSLASNRDVLKEKVEIDFGKMLSDDRKGKYVVIIFFAAIIYHIACIMNTKGYEMPRHISFSGNGSKILNVLSSDNRIIANFTKLIFEKVYGKPYHEDGLDIIRSSDSKESTCKGGIMLPSFVSQDYSLIKTMKTILLGTDTGTFADRVMKYDDISENMKDNVVENCRKFIDFVFDLDKDFSFNDEFDVDRTIMDKVHKLCERDVRTYLENGLEGKKSAIRQEGADDYIEETMFFYPLTGILNALARGIYNL